MKKDAIITLPNSHLRQKSQRVHVITDETRQLVADMTSASIDWENSRPHEISAALAAVQIDRLERVVIVREDFDDKDNRTFIPLINPEIVKYEGELISDYEGCLSVPGKTGIVTRPNHVKVKALNENMEPVTVEGEELLARALCHELDHLDGHLYTEMAEELYTNEELEEMQAEEDEDEA